MQVLAIAQSRVNASIHKFVICIYGRLPYIYEYKIIIGFPHLDGKREISLFCLKYIYISKYDLYLIQKNIHQKHITLFLYILI